MKNFTDLLIDYKYSLSILNGRIDELNIMKDNALGVCRKLHIDPQKDGRVIEIKDRLKPLLAMKRDLNEVKREVRHYYDRWWWRSETLTCNQRKSRSFLYAGPSG